jgi:hypothetical protein
MTPQSPFQYRQIIGDEIRLLTIEANGGRVSCTINHCSLAHTPRFYALSYAWGTDVSSGNIELDSQPFAVTGHLLTGLFALERQFGPAIPFWIDAICIDQSNDIEKSAQVRRMTEIYSSAELVVVWLGPAGNDSDSFLSQLSSLNEAFAGVTEIDKVNKHNITEYGLPPIEDQIWFAAFHLAFRPWFTRVWVVQEAVLAKSVLVSCGQHTVTLDKLTAFYNYLRSAYFMDDLVRQHSFQPSSAESGLHGLPIIGIWRQRRQAGGEIPVISLLSILCLKMASEAVDKIYGLMGLMSSDVRSRIAIDYSTEAKEHFWRLYVDVCRLLLEDGFAILNLTVSEQRDPNLPSWCPDFRRQPTANSLGVAFNAGVSTSDEVVARIPKLIAPAAGSDDIETRGLVMDRVKDVVELCHRGVNSIVVAYSPSLAKQVLECESRCLKISQAVYSSADQVPAEHIQTLVTAMHPDRSPYDAAQAAQDYANWKQWYRVMADGTSDHRPVIDQDLEISAARYNAGATIAWRGNCFFSTEGGRVGVGPRSLAKGDSVHVFFGAFVPHVLRYDASRQSYLFVGPAFVAGLMSGEAFWARDPLSNHERFVLR